MKAARNMSYAQARLTLEQYYSLMQRADVLLDTLHKFGYEVVEDRLYNRATGEPIPCHGSKCICNACTATRSNAFRKNSTVVATELEGFNVEGYHESID